MSRTRPTASHALPAVDGDITGPVTDTSNAPIVGANVTCSCGRASTDSNGNYLLAGLVDGAYTLTFSAGGHKPQTYTVTVSGGSGSQSVQLS